MFGYRMALKCSFYLLVLVPIAPIPSPFSGSKVKTLTSVAKELQTTLLSLANLQPHRCHYATNIHMNDSETTAFHIKITKNKSYMNIVNS